MYARPRPDSHERHPSALILSRYIVFASKENLVIKKWSIQSFRLPFLRPIKRRFFTQRHATPRLICSLAQKIEVLARSRPCCDSLRQTRAILLTFRFECRRRFGPIIHLLGREVLPLAPAVKIDQGLHATPLHDFSLKPDKVHRLYIQSIRQPKNSFSNKTTCHPQ